MPEDSTFVWYYFRGWLPWDALKTNLLLGWWGTISFVINPILILMNIGNYISSWKIRKTDKSSKISVIDWKLFIPLMILISIIFFVAFRNHNSNSLPQNSPSSTLVVPTITQVDNSSLHILYSEDFSTSTNDQVASTSDYATSYTKDGIFYISTLTNKYLVWSNTPTEFTDGILQVDLLNSLSQRPNITVQTIIWRQNDKNNFYDLNILSSGYVEISKIVDNSTSILYTSPSTFSCASLSRCTVIISFIGNTSKIYLNKQFVTTIIDGTFSSGTVGIGVSTSSTDGATAAFDNLIIYSSQDSTEIIPTENPTLIPSSTSVPTGKVIVTVKNNSSQPQEIYCEGIYIFKLNSGESDSFRFQKGNWRIDVCPIGKYPCNNYKYVNLNYDTVTYTIN